MKFLKRLQEKTEGERDRFVLIAAIGITLCIIALWICFEMYFRQEKVQQTNGALQQMKQSIAESWQSMFAK